MADTANVDSRLDLLLQLVESITASPDLDQVLDRVVRSATSLVEGSRSTVLIVEGSRLVVRARAEPQRRSNVPVRLEFELGEGLVGHAALERRTVLVSDALADPRTVNRAYHEAEGLRACAAIPLISHGRLVGVLELLTSSADELGPSEVEMLMAFGGHAAIAIESAGLYADAERRRREAETLADIARDLAEQHDLDAILSRIARGAHALCGGDVTSLALRDADGSFPARVTIGARSEAYRSFRVLPGLGIGGRAAVDGKPARTAERVAWPAMPPEYAAAIDAEGIHSAVVVPIVVDWKIDGLLYVCSRSSHSFSEADETLLVRLADHAATAIHAARLFAAEQAARSEAQASAMNLAGEREILGLIAAGAPTAGVLDAICRQIESTSDGLLASILLVDAGRLRHGAAPSLPRSYVEAIDGFAAAPRAGSCGTAAYRKETVVVSDIATDPLWADYRELALSHGLRACWSSPVLDGRGDVIATFALYRRVPGTRRTEETELVARATHLIRIVHERDRATLALQRSEEQYRTLVSHIPAVTWMADAGGATFVSPNITEVTGFAAEELIEQGLDGWLAHIHPDEVASVRERYEALELNCAPYDIAYRLRHRNGHWIWIHDSAMSACKRDGGVYFAGVLIDITARKEAELELQEQRRLMTHLTRVATLGELSGALAHELNQPLTAILTNAEAALQFLARRPVNLVEVREILQDIVNEDRRAGDVIRRLRALLRRGETPRQPLDVNEVTNEVLRLLHSELIVHGVAVTTQMAPGLPRVNGDRVALQQVLVNLIVNACDAMRLDEPAERRIAITTASDGGGAVRVTIVDRGSGLPIEDTERVFEPFFTTKVHGLGLGLAICRSIVAAHGGVLSARNNADRGAAFSFTLPPAAPGG